MMGIPRQIQILWIISLFFYISPEEHALRERYYNRHTGTLTYSDCIKYELLLAEINNISLSDTRDMCNNLYIVQMRTFAEHLKDRNVTNFVRHLLRGVRAEMEHNLKRKKRSVFDGGIRMRPEVREPPYDKNWGCYVRGVRRLKNNYDVRPDMNTYDVIASLHTNHHVKLASHDGPGFFSWHRQYLRIMELAIGCPIPYWDTRPDYAMESPQESVIWTDKYFGNGFGIVSSGLMENLYSPIPIIRNLNTDGWLISYEDVQIAMAKPTLYEFTEKSKCGKENRNLYSWECFHKGIHAWIGGTIGPATTTTFDPIFYPIHAFVDKIFELFRQKMIYRGMDPEINFPVKQIPFHGPEDKTLWVPYYLNIESLTHRECYGNKLAALTKYSLGPRCPDCYGSIDLYCDKTNNICVSKPRKTVDKYVLKTIVKKTTEGIQLYDTIATDEPERTIELIKKSGPLPFGESFVPDWSDPRARLDNIPEYYDTSEWI